MKQINIDEIEWERTGDLLDKISFHDYSEILIGFDKDGRMYEAIGAISCDEIEDIYDIEPFNKRIKLC